MAYQAIARKWRPGSFDEVVYQDHVSTIIKNSIKKGRISHAYLFSGPRGVGKTTMARIVARSLNCSSGPTENPCGSCDNCIEIRDGNSFDVIEIDGASNRGIENIRELRENVNFAPAKSHYKVYIIDEVHMLTKEAFNALLKTLEEPPPHIVFIFATTEIHKIPETILSRCQKYFFKKIPVDAIVDHLYHIVEMEKFSVDRKALYPLARASDGSMRDAQSLLDQIVSFSEGEISEEDTLALLGVVPIESYINMLGFVCDLNAEGAMKELDRIVSLGVDIARYAAGFVDVLRAVRLVNNDVSIKSILGLSDEELNFINGAAEKFNDEELSVMFQIAGELLKDLKYSSNERINLEMAFLDMIAAKRRPSISSLLSRLEDVRNIQPAASDGKKGGTEEADCRKNNTGITRKFDDVTKGIVKQDTTGVPENIAESDTAEDIGSRTENSSGISSESLPEDAVMIKNPEVDENNQVTPAIKKVMNTFHGKIIDKGDG